MNDDEMTALITSLALKKELKFQIIGIVSFTPFSTLPPASRPFLYLSHLLTQSSCFPGEARALYSQQYPRDTIFDVITMKRTKKDGSGSSGYESQLILYPTGAQYGEWTALLRSKGECEDPVDAMADLLEKMYSEVGKLVNSY